MYSDTDLGYPLVRFEAEYPKTGFGITRLVPVYDYSLPSLEFYPETAPNDPEEAFQAPAPVTSINHMLSRMTDDQKPVVHPENLDEESSYDAETWSKLPVWMKTLADLRRKARQAPSK